VGKVHLPEFLQQRLAIKKGPVIEVPADSPLFNNGVDLSELESASEPYHLEPTCGNVIGEHNGAHYYTIGQRKGLNLGGHAKPLFVIGTDAEKNIIYTGMGEDHPGLYRKGLFIPNTDIHWIREDLQLKFGESRSYLVRIRYRQKLEKCVLHQKDKGLYLIFDKPQKSITPGQFAAWYADEELIGSGVIS
jgi:tRNA-specific 2-thiouridylase